MSLLAVIMPDTAIHSRLSKGRIVKPRRDWVTTGATAVWFVTKWSPYLTSCWCWCSGCTLAKWKMQRLPSCSAHVACCSGSFLQLITVNRSTGKKRGSRRGLEKSHRRSRPSLLRLLWTCLGDGDVGPMANTIFIILVVPAVDTNNV